MNNKRYILIKAIAILTVIVTVCILKFEIHADASDTQLQPEELTAINEAVLQEIQEGFSYNIDKPLVTFVFDDALSDIDLVASIFAEYNIPLCLALILDNLDNKCSGLVKDTELYSVNMTVKEVAKQVTKEGGEVLAHGYTKLTNSNIYNKQVLGEVFDRNKQLLEKNGFQVNGIMLSGGKDALKGGTPEQGGAVMQYYASRNYLYSDQYGITEPYYHPRINLNKSTQSCKKDIQNAIINSKWIIFGGHSITGIYNEKYLTEKHLRELLTYCKDNNVEIVTYADVYSRYANQKNNGMKQ